MNRQKVPTVSSTQHSSAAEILSIPALNLPNDSARTPSGDRKFDFRTATIPLEFKRALERVSSAEGVGTEDILLAAFCALLFRYTWQEEIQLTCCAIPQFLLSVPGLSGDLKFVSLVYLVCKLAGQSRPSSNGRTAMPGTAFAFSYNQEAVANAGAPADWHLSVLDGRESLVLRFTYDQALNAPGTGELVLGHFQTLIEGAIFGLDQPLSKLPLLSAQEKQQIVKTWNTPARNTVPTKCLHELVEAQAAALPDAVAMICGAEKLSYSEFDARANQLAHTLRDMGVLVGSRVGICIDPSPDFAVAVLGVLKCGAACVPLDPKYPHDRLVYMLDDFKPAVVITEKSKVSLMGSQNCATLILDDTRMTIASQPRTSLNVKVSPSDLAYVIYTSGSTGKPRGVLLTHAGLANYNANMAREYGMTPADRTLQFCSISFDIAVEEMFITWLSGAALVFKTDATPLAVPEFLSWIEGQGITVLDLPTAYWHEWVHHFPDLQRPATAALRLVIVGGEKASAKAYSAWARTIQRSVRWVNTYGPTEASIAVTALEPDFDADAVPENIPIGRPIAGAQIYLLDPALNPVPVGIPGELHIGGVGVAQGYLNRPEMTAQKFIADPFSSAPGARLYKTGDLARFLPSGEIEFLGRRDDQVKIRGFRIELGEIELVMSKYSGMRECAVVAREDGNGEKRLVAYYVAKPDEKISVADLRTYLRSGLPDYMVPATFMALDSMPLTPNGKINRRGLPEPSSDVAIDEVVMATDELQAKLAVIWEEILGRKPIGIRDNFFELGGHSLLAARLMHRTGQALQKTLPLALLLQAPTIEQLATLLKQNGWSQHWSSLVPIQPAGSQPPFFCVHGVGGNVIGFSELARSMAPDHPFYGIQSQGLDGSRPAHGTIEEMAVHYLEEIRTVQPNGPYFVGGFSFGGLVAYEMARQLRARGERVGLLVLFDTYPGNLDPVGKSLVRVLLHPTWHNLTRNLPRAIHKRARRYWRGANLPQVLKDVRAANAASANRYVLDRYEGKLTLMRATERSLRSSSDPHAAWKELVGSMEIHDIPSDHYGILVEPQVYELANHLKSCIDKASLECEQTVLRIKIS